MFNILKYKIKLPSLFTFLAKLGMEFPNDPRPACFVAELYSIRSIDLNSNSCGLQLTIIAHCTHRFCLWLLFPLIGLHNSACTCIFLLSLCSPLSLFTVLVGGCLLCILAQHHFVLSSILRVYVIFALSVSKICNGIDR